MSIESWHAQIPARLQLFFLLVGVAPLAPGCHMRVRTVKHIPFNTKRPQRYMLLLRNYSSLSTQAVVRMPFALQCVLYACCKDQAVTATLVKPDPHSAARKLVCVWPRYRAKSASSTIALPITAIGSALALPAIAALCTARNRQLAPMRWQSIRSNRGTVDVGVMTTRAQ